MRRMVWMLCGLLLGVPALGQALALLGGGGGGGSGTVPPPTAAGTLLVGNTPGVWTLLPLGGVGTCLTVGGGTTTWGACATGSTGISAATLNGALYATSATTGTSTAALANGQLLIGRTGLAPVAASLSPTANQIAITPGAGIITISIPTNPTLPGTTTGVFSGSLAGNATTATSLAANPPPCPTGPQQFVTDIAADGTLTCALPPSLTASGPPSSGQLAVWTTPTNLTGTTNLPAAAFPQLTGDVITNAGALTTTLVNIPIATPMAGSLLATNIAAGAPPGPNTTRLYVDSTDKRLHDKNENNSVGTTVVGDPGATNNFLTAISGSGVIAKAQPVFGNLSGTLLAAQMLALTGDVTNPPGAVNTTIAPGAVTLAKMANIAQDRLLGRVAAGAGVPEVLTGAQARTLLGSGATYVAVLSPAAVTFTFAGGTHGLGTTDLTFTCWDGSTPRNWIAPNTVTVDPGSFDIVITFNVAQTARCLFHS